MCSKKNNRVSCSFQPLALMSSCAYIHVSCRKEWLLHATLCFQSHLNNIVINYNILYNNYNTHSTIGNANFISIYVIQIIIITIKTKLNAIIYTLIVKTKRMYNDNKTVK